MTISQAFSNATSGLGAASRQASVTSNNIANALTPGYHRRDVTLAERVLGSEGAGVMVAGIDRAQNAALTAQRRDADAGAAYSSITADAAMTISRLVGGPEDANALFGKFAAFDSDLRQLANAPADPAAQASAVSSGLQLTSAFNTLARDLQTMRADADTEIAHRVASLNEALRDVEALNESIRRATAAGQDASALLDERQTAIDKINQSIPVRELRRDDGAVDLMTHEGVFLLAGTAKTISFTPSPVIAAADQYAGGAGALSGLLVEGVDITPGGASNQAVRAGAVAGLFAVRDDYAPRAANELDALAADVISRFETAGVDPTIAPGAAALFTDAGSALAPPVAAGLAGRIELNAAVDPAQGGDPSRLRDGLYAAAPGPAGSDLLLRRMVDVWDAPQTVNASFAAGRALSALEGASELSSSVHAQNARLGAVSQSADVLATTLQEAELSRTGVDTDREMQNLLLIEQAYAANARVIEVASQMIQRLLEL
ncbi:MAG: flagellar hook-associated protein FlgK [Parvularculaceae bacterium]|nr:flagellar hook-associated protein FlgK [Parvularculaceae bacterium]